MKQSLFLILLLLVISCQSTETLSEAPPSEISPEITFFSFGDWGTGTQDQQNVADAVTVFCHSTGCDFGLLLGDNFYDEGVDSVSDPKWKNYFEDVYSQLEMPFYVALGNHDHLGNIQAQIDYTELQNRWILPARQYSQIFPEEAQTPLLEIFVIDSETFQINDGEALTSALDNSSAHWKILAMHHPLYSNGSHGDTQGLKNLLLPIVCQKVDLILSGHDHLFSHLSDPNDGCDFHQIVAGTGGKDLYSAQSDSRALFTKSTFGFFVLNVKKDLMEFRFYEVNQNLAYSFELKKLNYP